MEWHSKIVELKHMTTEASGVARIFVWGGLKKFFGTRSSSKNTRRPFFLLYIYSTLTPALIIKHYLYTLSKLLLLTNAPDLEI